MTFPAFLGRSRSMSVPILALILRNHRLYVIDSAELGSPAENYQPVPTSHFAQPHAVAFKLLDIFHLWLLPNFSFASDFTRKPIDNVRLISVENAAADGRDAASHEYGDKGDGRYCGDGTGRNEDREWKGAILLGFCARNHLPAICLLLNG